ncbi:MAG TPA: hypothetical protein VM008_12815 [Phycisphaerae bacterium]|nr:hypothetical protein [Phycisphaerae bacterium]
MNRCLLTTTLSLAAALFAGCTTNIRPIEPIRRVAMWVPDSPSTQPTTSTSQPATEPALIDLSDGEAVPPIAPLLSNTDPYPAATEPTTKPATTQTASTQSATTQLAATQTATSQRATTEPTTRVATTESAATQAATTQSTTAAKAFDKRLSAAAHPGQHLIVRVIDPNQTSRYIYHASYDNIWQQAMKLLTNTGFTLDRKDYRLGILTTKPLPSAQFVEPWKPQQTNFTNAMENTINMQQRTVRLSISPVPLKPDFYEIGIQVLVERQNNPIEQMGGPIFVEGSGFGRAQVSLRSDYTPAVITGIGPSWYVLGHDPDLEKKLLTELFKHI